MDMGVRKVYFNLCVDSFFNAKYYSSADLYPGSASQGAHFVLVLLCRPSVALASPPIALSNTANLGAAADAYLHGCCPALAFRHQIMV